MYSASGYNKGGRSPLITLVGVQASCPEHDGPGIEVVAADAVTCVRVFGLQYLATGVDVQRGASYTELAGV